MSQIAQSSVQNLLLRSIPAAEFETIQAHMEWIDFDLGDVLCEPKQKIQHALFIEDGVCSVIAVNKIGASIETGLVGKEGFLGASILLNIHHSSHQLVAHGVGRALKIPFQNLTEALGSCQRLNTILLHFIHTFNLQIAHTALANAYYTIEQRLARWLLMAQDRLGAAQFRVTHEFLAVRLAVRRSSVTAALHLLEGKHVIRSTRSQVRIISRAGLEEVAAGSYGTPEDEYENLICRMRRPTHEFDQPELEPPKGKRTDTDIGQPFRLLLNRASTN